MKRNGFFERSQGFVNEAGAVVKRHNGQLAFGAVGQNFFGQPGRNFFDFIFYIVDYLQRVGSKAGHYHAANHFGAVFVESAPAAGRPQSYHSNIFYADGNIFLNGNHGFFDVFHLFDIAQAAHQIFRLVDFDGFGAHIPVGFLNGLHHFVQWNVVGFQRVRVYVDLVFLHKAANGCYFRNPFGGVKSVFHIKILNRTNFVQVPAPGGAAVFVAPFDGVPIHLPQSRGIGTKRRLHAFRQQTRWQRTQLFQYPRARPVKLYIIREDDEYAGKAKNGRAADRFHARNAEQISGERIRNLVFDILRRTARPFCKYDLLVFANVGDSIHRYRVAGQNARIPTKGRSYNSPAYKKHQYQKSNQLVFEKKTNNFI